MFLCLSSRELGEDLPSLGKGGASGCKHPGVGWFLVFVHTANVPILDQRRTLPILGLTHMGKTLPFHGPAALGP